MNEFMYEVVMTLSDTEVLKKTDANGVIFWIPMDESNSDYIAYLESLNDNTVEAE